MASKSATSSTQDKYNVPVSNTWETVMPADADMEVSPEPNQQSSVSSQQSAAGSSSTAPAPKVKKPPPIVVTQGFKQPREFFAQLKTVVKGDYRTSRPDANGVKIYVNTSEDFSAVQEFLKTSNVEYYTYSTQKNQTKKLVLKAASFLTDGEVKQQITTALQSTAPAAASAVQCVKMRGGKKPSSSFLVTVPKTTDTANLKKITAIDHMKVQWQRFSRKATVTQCHRCQMFGHGSTQCNRAPRCVKCIGKHVSRECPNKVRGSVPVKCCNCGGDHTANYSKCPAYIRYVNSININNKSASKNTNPQPKPQPFQEKQFDFPALKNKSYQGLPNTGATLPQPLPQLQSYSSMLKNTTPKRVSPPTRVPPPPTNPPSVSGFSDLMTEINELHELINYDALVECVREIKSIVPNYLGKGDALALSVAIRQISIKYGF